MRSLAHPPPSFPGAAVSHFGFHPLPVEIGKDGGHRGVQIHRNGLAGLDRAVQRAGERRILDDRNVILFSNLADGERQMVDAFGDADRRCHFA